jgi:predicted DsbA family dithiol-disulfide isomerase
MTCSWCYVSKRRSERTIAAGGRRGVRWLPFQLDANRLIWLADAEGVQDAMVEALFGAYFTEGRVLERFANQRKA